MDILVGNDGRVAARFEQYVPPAVLEAALLELIREVNGFRCQKCGIVYYRFLLTRNYHLFRLDGHFRVRSFDLANITVTIEGEVNEVIATLKGMAGWSPSESANEVTIDEVPSSLQPSEPPPTESTAPEKCNKRTCGTRGGSLERKVT